MQDWTSYDVDDIASGLQEFLICIEMFFAAIAHAFAFPPRDYMDPNGQQPRGILRNLRIMFDVRDVVDDVQGAVDHGVRPSFRVWLSESLSRLFVALQSFFSFCRSSGCF
jgi:Organic solute transporter Ostalpha